MMPVLYVASAFLAALTVMSAWLFRSSAAPLWVKIALPLFTMAAAWSVPMTFNAVAGYPVATTFEKLPDCFDVVAFSADDTAGTIALWLNEKSSPRSYSLPIDKRLVEGIKIFVSQWQPGATVGLCKDGAERERGDSPYTKHYRDMNGSGGLHLDHPPIVKGSQS